MKLLRVIELGLVAAGTFTWMPELNAQQLTFQGLRFQKRIVRHFERGIQISYFRNYELWVQEAPFTQKQFLKITGIVQNPALHKNQIDCPEDHKMTAGGLCPGRPMENLSKVQVANLANIMSANERLTLCYSYELENGEILSNTVLLGSHRVKRILSAVDRLSDCEGYRLPYRDEMIGLKTGELDVWDFDSNNSSSALNLANANLGVRLVRKIRFKK